MDFEAGTEATRSPETARDAYPAYRQMGIDFERRGQFTEAAIAYSNASMVVRALGRLQDALTDGQKTVEMAERSESARPLGIFGLDLHASLVVLSACETALGTLTRGDELTGLTRAFIYAGTPSVITTLWQVNDRSAFELMREFYRQLRAGRNKAEALRLAQLAILDIHPRPYHWAAYELIGEPR